jgi:hypothetical protein
LVAFENTVDKTFCRIFKNLARKLRPHEYITWFFTFIAISNVKSIHSKISYPDIKQLDDDFNFLKNQSGSTCQAAYFKG